MNNIKKQLNFNNVNDIQIRKTAEPEVILHNNKIIQEFVIEDLEFIEKDLEFYEKVQLLFLLYSHNHAMVGLQKILTASRNIAAPTDFLTDWAKKEEKWKEALLEALSIAQINSIIAKLGLNVEEIQERFVPDNPDLNLYIHPIVRALYIVCDSLKIEDSKQMITYIQDDCNYRAEFFFPVYIEIHILDWIQRSFITLGDWSLQRSSCIMNEFCDINRITTFLKLNGFEDLKDILHNASIRLSYTRNNRIRVDEPEPQREIKETIKEMTQKSKSPLSATDINPRTNNIVTNSSEFYKITKENAGYILIINQQNFHIDIRSEKIEHGLQKRMGTETDKKKLCEVFSRYGFIPREADNLTDTEIMKAIDDVVRDSRDKDALIVCILSHGKNGVYLFYIIYLFIK